MKRALIWICASWLFSAANFAADTSNPKFRELLGIPADAQLQFVGQNGEALSREEFERRTKVGVRYKVIKDPERGIYKLSLERRPLSPLTPQLELFKSFKQSPPSGAPGPWRSLLDAKLSSFDAYLSYHGQDIMSVIQGKAPKGLEPIGLNPKGQKIFTVIEQEGKPVLRISGEIYGCLQTREEFSNYHLRLETRWGEKKWVPRLDEPKDSGILYHSRGPFGVDYWKSWALSHEFQVIEQGLGEYWTQATSAIDIRAEPATPDVAPRWDPSAPWMTFSSPNNHALAIADEERPGEWNRLELVCFGDDCAHIVNERVVMVLRNARHRDGDRWIPMTGGRIQIQSEAAEVFYRNIEIRSIPALPAELAQYFN